MRKQAWKSQPLLGQKLLESEEKMNVEWLPSEILLGQINTPPFGASFVSGGPRGDSLFHWCLSQRALLADGALHTHTQRYIYIKYII